MADTNDKKVELGFGRKFRRTLSAESSSPTSPNTLGKWKLFSAIAQESTHDKDPWAYIVNKYPTERGVRYRYDINKREFFTDEVSVKIESEPFAHGAMRECFRMKKLSHFVSTGSDTDDWHLPFANVVCKKYFKDTDRQAYFDDVKLQMDAKYWAIQYDRADPPKKIDIMQMMIVELPDRPDKPLYHVESLIEGEYIKYNSNSGYVETCRNTPQAFSHFTFEASGHRLMVVDVQGVGDLYTDPQIHTYDGREYGSGNLATKGMALFFNSHKCNVICEALGLSKFDLTKKEKKRTITIGDGVTCIRSCSMSSVESDARLTVERDDHVFDSGIEDSVEKRALVHPNNVEIRIRNSSGTLDVPLSPLRAWDTEELRRSGLYNSSNRRPSCVMGATRSCDRTEELESNPELEITERATILGQIHFDLAVYHYMGRFEEAKECDSKSAIFHLTAAASCGLSIAEFTLACLHLNIYHDEMKELELTEDEDEAEGVKLIELAAKHGNLVAILTVGQAYHGGQYGVSKDWKKADKYYHKYTELCDSQSAYSTFEPVYQILAKRAEMIQYGGNGLPKDPLKSGEMYTEAAEAAMSAMNGKLANKWYMLAEEVWAECDEE